MQPSNREIDALQAAGTLCGIAALLQVLGGYAFHVVSRVGYAVASVGLFKGARSGSRWGAAVAGVCASLNGLINLMMVGYELLLLGSNSAGPGAVGFLVNNSMWLIGNALIFAAV